MAIIGTSSLVPYLLVKSLQLFGRLGTRRWNLRVPSFQMSCSDLTWIRGYQVNSSSNGCQVIHPITMAYCKGDVTPVELCLFCIQLWNWLAWKSSGIVMFLFSIYINRLWPIWFICPLIFHCSELHVEMKFDNTIPYGVRVVGIHGAFISVMMHISTL